MRRLQIVTINNTFYNQNACRFPEMLMPIFVKAKGLCEPSPLQALSPAVN